MRGQSYSYQLALLGLPKAKSSAWRPTRPSGGPSSKWCRERPEDRIKVFVDGSIQIYYASQLQADEMPAIIAERDPEKEYPNSRIPRLVPAIAKVDL